jgi:hypothetical protein
MLRNLLVLLFLILLKWGISAQNLESSSIDNQLWLDYSVKVKTATGFSYGGDASLRGLWLNYEWNQFLIRPTVNYKINRTFDAALAVALFQIWNKNYPNITEFRIHQDFSFEWPPVQWFSVFGRARLEQRFFSYQAEELSNEFRVRGRLLLGIQSQDLTWFGEKRPIFFQTLYEGFQTFGNDTNFILNQSRFHIALGHRIASNWRYEIHFIRQGARLNPQNELRVNQHIFRLRVFHTIDKKKSKNIIEEIENN